MTRLITPERLLEENVKDDSIEEDFRKCYDLAMHGASYWPEMANVWTGTVSERLQRVLILERTAREDVERENEALRQIIREARDAIQQLLDADFGCGCCSEGDTWKTAPAAGKAVLERMRAAIGEEKQ